jgi:hypothetical protein
MNKLDNIISSFLLKKDEYLFSLKKNRFNFDQPFVEIIEAFKDRNDMYAYMHHHFLFLAPKYLLLHRNYFKQSQRGFGEDAFHSMWLKIFTQYRPKLALEIGVYRGQVITLWALISGMENIQCEIHGLSPFSPAGDCVSDYLKNLDYRQDVIDSCENLKISPPNLMQAFSNEPNGIAYVRSIKWDLIYIDGNHDYEVALNDYEISKDSLSDGGILVMDDSSLYTEYRPRRFSFSGHPGPSKIVRDLAMREMKFLCAVGHNNIFMKI